MPEPLQRSDEPQNAPTENESNREIDADRIAQRAYERFQMRGGEHGRDQEDWFEAERELKQSAGE